MNLFAVPVSSMWMTESDEALYAKVKAGDMAAFDVLYARYERPLFCFILSQTRSRADAEEIFQDAFMNALKSREVRFDIGFRSWIYRVARNLILNRVRSRERGGRAMDALPERAPEPNAPEVIDGLQRDAALQHAVAKLPEGLSELYRLRTAGLSYEEMAAVLELPLGTLKSRFHQLIVQLKEALQPWTAT